MELLLLRINDVYVNTERIDHFGALFSLQCHGRKYWKFYIPIKGETDTNRAITFTRDDIDTVFFSSKVLKFGAPTGGITDFQLVGFVLNDINSNSKKFIILNLGEFDDENPTAGQYRWGEKIMTPLVNEKKNFWFAQQDPERLPNNAKDYFDVLTLFESNKVPRKDFFVSRNFVSGYFLQLYADFITKYPSVTKKEAKKLIRGLQNVPQFLKLSWNSPSPMLLTITTFMLTHVCENLKCEKLFSILQIFEKI